MIKPMVLIIIDGWGLNTAWGGNAISLARTPFFDNAWSKYPKTSLFAHGEWVGLSGNEAGNSEVGHLNIGAGRLLEQTDNIINKSISNKSFFANKAFIDAIENCKNHSSALHLIGLVSEGKVHSDINHLFALLEVCKQQNFKNVKIHVVTDGRDTPPMSALIYIDVLENKIKELGIGEIKTIMGRYYAMDRDNRWDRTKVAYGAIVDGTGEQSTSSRTAVSNSYTKSFNDEFITPTIIKGTENNSYYQGIQQNDSVIFFNFRSDRMKQLTNAIINKRFKGFLRKSFTENIFFVTMTPYEYDDINKNIHVAFTFEKQIKNTLSEVLSTNCLNQLHIAETEKYAHVTYFFGGGNETVFQGQKNILINSPRVAYYNQSPRMSADKISDYVVKNMQKYAFILVNFANADMVGHTGDLQSAISACEATDENIAKICKEILLFNGCAIITADHGNAEQMLNQQTLEPYTEHTSNKVPFIIFSKQKYQIKSGNFALSSISPTILSILGINKPAEMTAESLI